MCTDVSGYPYPLRLSTFAPSDWPLSVATQLAALGHVAERPPLEVLEHGSRCITCSKFVRKDLSIRALGDSQLGDYVDDFRGFAFHAPECRRLQVRVPLEPQAVLGGLYARGGGAGVGRMRWRFETGKGTSSRVNGANEAADTRRGCPLFTLPLELRLEIYALVLPRLDPTATEILPLNRDSPRVITRAGYEKTGPRDTTKPAILRTCRAIHAEATDLLYHFTTFSFTAKTMYLFLRAIGAPGRERLRSVDVLCGSREDAMAFALLSACETLRSITIRLPRPRILWPCSPLWVEEGMACLLSLRGVKEVKFGWCETSLGCMRDAAADARVIRRELTLPRGAEGMVRWVDGGLDV